ncbi:hypothetical protein Golomagni_07016 [Golovinomyces magnicellulatus]|nr:hypothetical protein Golomagni_07016 [Golovinomyces magnicellulatus]
MVREHRSEEDPLDKEIATLKRQVTSLRRRLQVECSTILSASTTQNIIQSSSSNTTLTKRSSEQEAYAQQCAYRISTAVTAFKIHDPDPNAVDSGNVLGIRFEVMSIGQFLRPYYVMLNRPYANSRHLRVHRHTIPPAIALAGLAARHLPPPRFNGEEETTQDLQHFVRAVRRDIIRYHNRLGVTADLRRSARLHQAAQKGQNNDTSIIDVGIADIEAKQITLTWADERSGRLVVDDEGKVLKFAVFGSEGRDWLVSEELLRGGDRVEDITATLEEYVKS